FFSSRRGHTRFSRDWSSDVCSSDLAPIVARLKAGGMRVSLFVDPDPRGYDKAKAIGADRIELYTGPYGATFEDPAAAVRELNKRSEERRVGKGSRAGWVRCG